jgi:hypothetical protein
MSFYNKMMTQELQHVLLAVLLKILQQLLQVLLTLADTKSYLLELVSQRCHLQQQHQQHQQQRHQHMAVV